MLTAYVIFKVWVFTSKKHNGLQQLSYYVVINLLGLAQTIVVSLIFFNYIFIDIGDILLRETISHILGLAAPIATSYIGHKYITFK